jgi:hypothetical protein
MVPCERFRSDIRTQGNTAIPRVAATETHVENESTSTTMKVRQPASASTPFAPHSHLTSNDVWSVKGMLRP